MPSVFDPKASIYSDMKRVGFPLRELWIPVLLFFREQPKQNFAEIHRKFLSLCITSPFHTIGLTWVGILEIWIRLFSRIIVRTLSTLCDPWRDDMKAHNVQSNLLKLESRKPIEILLFSHGIFTGSSFDHFLTFRCCLPRVASKNKAKVLFRIIH